MTAVPSRSPNYLQPRAKSSGTSVPPLPGSKSPSTPSPHSNNRQVPSNSVSDQATASLIRRTLCSPLADKSAPISELLPPLTSRNDVDLQLYAFIAIVIKEFVYTWYAKITPDQEFVAEVVKIIAHCTRGVEQRLRKVDLEALVFDELPELLEAHVKAYRIANSPLHPPPTKGSPRHIYHSLWPTPALSPVPDENDPATIATQKENEAAYRQLLVQGTLAVLLPTEDLENACLTSLVGQILSEMIIGNGIGGKACEPWLLWEGIMKITESVESQLPKAKAQVRANKSKSQPVETEKGNESMITKSRNRRWSPQKTFWLLLQYAFLAFNAIRFVVITIATSSSLPSRVHPFVPSPGSGPVRNALQPPAPSSTPSSLRKSLSKQPILKMKIWSCVSILLDVDVRMPWLSATVSMLQWCALRGPGCIGETDGMLDKLLSHLRTTTALSPSLIAPLLRTTRSALFPSNAPAPPRPVPSPPDQLLIRRRCAECLLRVLPKRPLDLFLGPGPNRRLQDVEDLLDLLADPYCNRHLLYAAVELLLVRLMPELAEMPVADLVRERLS